MMRRDVSTSNVQYGAFFQLTPEAKAMMHGLMTGSLDWIGHGAPVESKTAHWIHHIQRLISVAAIFSENVIRN